VLVITNARLLTMEKTDSPEDASEENAVSTSSGFSECFSRGVIEKGFIAVEENRIVQIGPMDRIPPELLTDAADQTDKMSLASELNQVLDAKGGWILPGFIDAHSHLGLFDDSLDFEGSDGNEDTDPITPQLRAIDGIHNADVCFREAYEAGVSIVMAGPGSGNVMGGQFALLHTYERTVDRAVIQAPSAQKVAFGENPKRVYGKDDKAPSTRMGTAGLLRDTLFKALEYREKWDEYTHKKTEYDLAEARNDEDIPDSPDRPDFDFQLESLFPVLSGSIPLKIHAHRQDDILTAVRICNEFGLKYTIEHCTEGHKIADVLYEEYSAGQVPGRGTGNKESKGGKLLGVIVGPIIGDRSKPELSSLTTKTAGILHRAGLPVAIMTDHPCVPQQYLLLSTALAVKGGLPDSAALSSITLTAAEICGISDQYGSLTVGKKADLTLFSGDPYDYRSRVLLFVGAGVVRFDPEKMLEESMERHLI